jgi:hypothetical protein
VSISDLKLAAGADGLPYSRLVGEIIIPALKGAATGRRRPEILICRDDQHGGPVSETPFAATPVAERQAGSTHVMRRHVVACARRAPLPANVHGLGEEQRAL